ncbi:galanin peptides isoform X1 [Ictalurus furcatus]|uniref:galanin peptides isoform X1 n=1 Tax=Ictalurus furcatus TaxID=66913 RepID=UPI0023500044|nr:galanin peptides isoform X1 [Ictalurus furcatus]
MHKCIVGVCITLVFCAVLTETLGMVIAAKEKRGWTLNSAGYLLGPRRIDHLIQIKDAPSARGREELLGEYGIDSYRTLSDKHGLAGKRDAFMEDDIKSGALRIADEDILHTIVDFLSFLKLKGGRGSELIRLQCENITLSGKKKDMNINNQRNIT